MNKVLLLGIMLLISLESLSGMPKAFVKKDSSTFNLSNHSIKEVILDDFSETNSSVEFDIVPQNSSAQVGVLFRYIDKDNWVYVGCDKATDHLGFASWYVTTPSSTTKIATDISKLYAHHLRRIKINCVGKTITVYVDGEQIAHQFVADIPEQLGRIGFRVHDKGDVRISNICCKPMQQPYNGHQTKEGTHTISSAMMEVAINKNFPSVRSYTWKKNGAKVSGQPFDVKKITINGDYYTPRVTSRKESSNKVMYMLKVEEIAVVLDVCCEVVDNILQLQVINIKETGDLKVKTIAFPDHFLVSIPNSAPGASLSIANSVHSDSFLPLKDKTIDNVAKYGTILILNSDQLAASLESNSIYNTRQFLYQSVKTSSSNITGIWGNEWIYRGGDGAIVNQPYIKVVLSDDCNNDNKVDWQDGAIALQKIYPEPFGVDMLRNSYATITMNFASCAQYPFLRQLDNIKKFYLATDGFSQMIELKGYQSEGHDSAHPDYGGNYNRRAGGVNDFAFMVKEAKKYNAHIGVHINHSESYPEARAFNDRIVTDMPAWSWLDQSYFINKEADMLAGGFEGRLQRLKTEVPDLSFVYLDTYREYRWLAHRTAQLFNERNWAVWTEDSDVFDKEAIWIHYNPQARSLIHRFIHHMHRDGYATHPALMGGYSRGAEIGFMGWQKGRDFNGVIRNFFTKQLPYRYLMHYPVLQLDSVSCILGTGLKAYGNKENSTVIKRDKQVLMTDGNVFIPWDPITEQKIYHYNTKGGNTLWQLPSSWSDVSKVFLYILSSDGRTFVRTIDVNNNTIEIDAIANRGYVIYKERIADREAIEWSAGSLVKDMGFDSKSFKYWSVTGDTSAVSFKTTTYGQDYLSIKGSEITSVKQQIEGLLPEKEYTVSVWVKVTGNKQAMLEIDTGDGKSYQKTISESNVFNYTDNTDRFRTFWQRMKIPFCISAGNSAVISLMGMAANDTTEVCFDDVRIVESKNPSRPSYSYFEDFEHVDEGWGPFIASQPSAFTTHLAQKHDVYTDNTIHGEWSLFTWRERNGEVYRTSPAMIRFLPGVTYEMEFDYKTDKSGVYKVVGVCSSSEQQLFSYDLNRSGKCRVCFTSPSSPDFYIAVIKQGDGSLVIDDFGIKGDLAI